ncbi:MAG: beta-ketoacyl-ACP synthase 3 [Solirubrobacterales bacterium]|nr:beta-ketoacyl-ACP synthase 3 [Solirubrobacterales bacterium]
MPDTAVTERPALGSQRAVAGAAIGAAGMAVPEQVVENAVIAERLGVEPQWIVKRTGISRRHVLAPGERLIDMAAKAGGAALARAELDPGDVDLVLVATTSKDHITPDAAPLVAAELGARRAGAFDVGAACTGFVAAVAVARGQIETGAAERVLVIGADALFQYTDPDDRRTAALFGDGAGAVVMTATDPPGRVSTPVLRADGGQADLIFAERDEAKLHMEGRETFDNAVARLSEVTGEALARAGIGLADVDLFVYHQANRRILRAVGERLELAPERVLDYIAEYANTSAATIPIALAEAQADGTLATGQRLLFAAFGAGFTWGAVVVDWGLDEAR